MRNRFQRDVVDTRQPGGTAARQPRQFLAVTLGKVPLGNADLLFYQMEVV